METSNWGIAIISKTRFIYVNKTELSLGFCKQESQSSLCQKVVVPPSGGCTLIFSAYIGSDPGSTVHTQKISGISSTQKNIWNLNNPQKYPNSVPLTLKKPLKCIEITLKLAQFCDDPPINNLISTKSSYPNKYSFFWKPNNYWNSEFWTQKIAQAYVCVKISVYPPPPPPPMGFHHTIASFKK